MRALIFIEHTDGTVSDTTFEMAQLAKSIGADCFGLVCAKDADTAAGIASQLKGFLEVSTVLSEAVEYYNPEAVLIALKSAVDGQSPDLVMTSYSTAGVDLAPALAIQTGRPMLGYVTALERNGDTLTASSQIYGGKLVAQTTIPTPAVIAVMPGATKVEEWSGDAPVVTELNVDFTAARTRVREIITPTDTGVNLADADRILCIGRALGGTEKLPVAEELAAALNAEIAGSRPVIDAGWLPKVRQVGKSGTKVKPKLYLMAGVSGAPEHLEGMASSELIIAINSDEQAPIFQKAHYGAVCDMFQLLPALTARLNEGTK